MNRCAIGRLFLAPLFCLLGATMASPADLQRVTTRPGDSWSAAVRDGRFVHVSSVGPAGADGRVTGDIRAQTRATLDALSAVLSRAGTALPHAASVHVYLRHASDFAAMNEVYATYWSGAPPVRTTIVAGLAHPDALVEMSAVGLMPDAPREVVHPPGWVTSPNPYSYGIRSGDTLFLAGLVSRSGRDNALVPGDITGQTRTVLQNAREILEAAGMSLADVVSARVFLTDGAAFPSMNAAYRTAFASRPPARATVLCDLMNPAFLVEITLVAVSGSKEAVRPLDADGSPRPANPNLSAAITAGDRVFVAGMLGNTEATRGDVRGQTRETLAALGRALKAAGVDWTHVTDAVVYLTDPRQAEAMDAVWRETFGDRGPARTVLGAGLVAADGLVEIMLNATRQAPR